MTNPSLRSEFANPINARRSASVTGSNPHSPAFPGGADFVAKVLDCPALNFLL
jgi:hypothetical protein